MKFKGFWKEYWELCKAAGRWVKDYWFLFIIWNIIIVIFTYVRAFGWDSIFPKKEIDDEELAKEEAE